ncbi:hypothetical protein QL285_009906 [Trifolium repens]|nr:hypothetical protein QL285_009906 [Trifolium repens]
MASIVPRWKLLAGQNININKSEENLFKSRTQIRRKTYKSRKKHQDKVQNAKRKEKTQKVKKSSIPSQHDDFHRATMKDACLPRKQKNKSDENMFIAARWSISQHDGVTWRPS